MPRSGHTQNEGDLPSGQNVVDILSGKEVKLDIEVTHWDKQCGDNSSWLKIGRWCWQLSRVKLVDEQKKFLKHFVQNWISVRTAQ
jgi:hypothetical protein